jgi:hypothetical protein
VLAGRHGDSTALVPLGNELRSKCLLDRLAGRPGEIGWTPLPLREVIIETAGSMIGAGQVQPKKVAAVSR